MNLKSIILPSAIKHDLAAVDELLADTCQSPYESIDTTLHYAVSVVGKRLRALLVILLSHACGYKGKRHIKIAAAIELMHLATLLHDDVIDKAETRRAQPTLRTKCGDKASILAGDLLYATAFQYIVELRINELNASFTSTTQSLVEGELLQATITWDTPNKEIQYFDIIDKKTASLFALCAEAVSMLVGHETKIVAMWGQYARNLGMAFQVIDDILDFTAKKSGKQIGNDAMEGKITLPMLYAEPFLTIDEKAQLLNANENNITNITSSMERVGAFLQAKETATEYCNKSLTLQRALRVHIKSNIYANLLEELPGLIVERDA